MNGCQFSLPLLLIVNIDLLHGLVQKDCPKKKYPNDNQFMKPACYEGETCIELDVKNFTVYVEDHCDYVNPFDYMSIVSRYEGGEYYTYDGLQLKTGKRDNKEPLIFFSRHQIPSEHDPPFFAQLYSDSVEIVTMGGKPLGKQEGYGGGTQDVYRIQTKFNRSLSVAQVKRAFVYKEYMFLSSLKVVDFRKLYDRRGPYDNDAIRPGLLEESNVGVMDIWNIPNEHIDRDFLNLIMKKCFRDDKFCSLDTKTESLDLQYYPAAFTYDDLVMEPFWFQRYCEMSPMYRIRHKKTAPNVIFDFPEVETLVTHGEKLFWIFPTSTDNKKLYYERRGLLPIIQPNDPFFDFVKKYIPPPTTTTTTPPPTKTTLKPVLADPKPKVMEIEEDSVEFEEEHVIEVIVKPEPNNGPAISTIPIIYYMLGYITFYLKSFHL